MYRKADQEQMGLEPFFLPFEGCLDEDNRWVKLAKLMPWDHIEEIYLRSMEENSGREAIPARIAFGSIYIKEQEKLSDERTVQALQENPYMQYFVGLQYFHAEQLFDPSMMVHFRKRFPVEEVAKINEYVCTGKWPEEMRNIDRNDDDSDQGSGPRSGGGSRPDPNTSKKKLKRRKNKGKLLLDATAAPADIKYPTDIDLLNQSREHLETAIDIVWKHVPHTTHKQPYSRKKARKSYLKVAKSKKWTKRLVHRGIGEQLRYVEQAMVRLAELETQVPAAKEEYPFWLKDRLNVIPQVYEQQKEMYLSETHNCEQRIVSLQQPHVRPIVRGKRPNPTEFGQKLHLSVVDGYIFLEQTSWENFNEGSDLSACVEEYHRRFGCYPAAVLADRIYQTRANRLYCKELGIRLSGPPLGRRKASVTDAAIERLQYKDSCERNAIEGKTGVSKRRFGLDLILAKLDETAKTEAALVILATNAAHRLRLWLAHFRYSLFLPFRCPVIIAFQ